MTKHCSCALLGGMLCKALANGFNSLACVYAGTLRVYTSTLAGVLRIIHVLSEMLQITIKQHHYLYVQ